MKTYLPSTHLIISGVSGCGKTSVAQELHKILGWPYAEADDFHSPTNKEKMAEGYPLTDEDRWPWLRSLRDWMSAQAAEGHSTIVTCSALKKVYRDVLREATGNIFFVQLTGSEELLARRMAQREGHFMPTSLLPSQLAIFEPLTAAESGMVLDVAVTPQELAQNIIATAMGEEK